MEKVLSADERIRRAEEIYYRRKMNAGDREIARVNVSDEKKNFGLLKKTLLQIAICVVIYLILHLVQTTNYIFSEDILNKAKDILSYDINFEQIYNNTLNYINGLWPKKEKEENNKENAAQNETQEVSLEEEPIIEETLGVAEENIEELTQEEQDVKYILENKSFIIPLNRCYNI